MPSQKRYVGPVVYIIHPLFDRHSSLNGAFEHHKVQASYHATKIQRLLSFAKKHGLPVFYDPGGSNQKLFYKMAQKAGIPKREIINPQYSRKEWKREVSATTVIFAGAYRGICVKGGISWATQLWPRARLVLLTGSYTFQEPREIYSTYGPRKGIREQLKRSRVKMTNKLGRHLLRP